MLFWEKLLSKKHGSKLYQQVTLLLPSVIVSFFYFIYINTDKLKRLTENLRRSNKLSILETIQNSDNSSTESMLLRHGWWQLKKEANT